MKLSLKNQHKTTEEYINKSLDFKLLLWLLLSVGQNTFWEGLFFKDKIMVKAKWLGYPCCTISLYFPAFLNKLLFIRNTSDGFLTLLKRLYCAAQYMLSFMLYSPCFSKTFQSYSWQSLRQAPVKRTPCIYNYNWWPPDVLQETRQLTIRCSNSAAIAPQYVCSKWLINSDTGIASPPP